VPNGALVSSVEKDSPAQEAGLKVGDVITAFAGRNVASAGELPALVASTKPGSRVAVTVWRDHARHEVQLKVGSVTDGESVAAAGVPGEGGRLGMTVRPLSPSERSANDGEDGLLVEGVDGAAADAGIRPGDIVLSANGQRVHEVGELRAAVAGAKKHIALLVQRGDARVFVPIELG
jgi:serine protease Do